MFTQVENMKPKIRIAVELVRHDGTVASGDLFVCGKQRILDLLNDHRQFLPLECADGETLIVSKSSIATIKPFDGPLMAARAPRIPLAHPRRATASC